MKPYPVEPRDQDSATREIPPLSGPCPARFNADNNGARLQIYRIAIAANGIRPYKSRHPSYKRD